MPARRPRDPAGTQAALLEAARRLFTERGYNGVGVREIAQAAGADKALITRYFGSKEGLFGEAIAATIDVTILLRGERSRFGETVIRHLVESRDSTKFKPTIALHRSVCDPAASMLLRKGLEERFVAPLAEWLGGEQANLRASALTAQIAGLEMMINVLPLEALATARIESLVDKLAPLLQALVEPNSEDERV